METNQSGYVDVQKDLPSELTVHAQDDQKNDGKDTAPVQTMQAPPMANEEAAPPPFPLISCIMPTSGRPGYVLQAVHYFLQQDYPNKELIIVFNKTSDLPAINYPENVRLVQTTVRMVGAMRNECCRHALGAIIAQWDDDDIYNTNRLTSQALPILRGEADITGLQHFVFYEAPARKCWLASRQLFNEIYQPAVHGGSFVYNRELWAKLSPYPNLACGEDIGFLKRVLARGARLQPINGYGSFVYVRHNSNTWKFEDNNFRRYTGWMPVSMPEWAQAYQRHFTAMHSSPALSSQPGYPVAGRATSQSFL